MQRIVCQEKKPLSLVLFCLFVMREHFTVFKSFLFGKWTDSNSL